MRLPVPAAHWRGLLPSLVDVLAPLVVVESLVVMLRVLDLFSGIGGFSLGLERAGMRTVAFCEIDPYCRAVLRRHWPRIPIFPDVRKLGVEQTNCLGDINVICGGFPCQDISLLGAGAGLSGARSGLWSEFRRLIEEAAPRFVIIENVVALRSRGLATILRDLDALGFDAEWHCIPASAVGAPHQRDRLWIIAYPQGFGRLEIIINEHTPARGWTTDRRPAGRPENTIREWVDLSGVRGVVHGLPYRVDRVSALGNTVIPQIPEIIGRAIMAASKA